MVSLAIGGMGIYYIQQISNDSKNIIKDNYESLEYMKEIIETTIQYAIDFDLLVPPYDQVKIATVEQMQSEINHSRIQTGKRLGFKFNSDDV